MSRGDELEGSVTQEWYWEQGTKYAIEAMKTALLLNGAAAIALMTFANTRKFSGALISPLVWFASGAMLAAMAFGGAYLAQLTCGNSVRPGIDEVERARIWKGGKRWSSLTILLVFLSVVAFLVAVILTAFALPKLEPLG
jgi:hypothetical protein